MRFKKWCSQDNLLMKNFIQHNIPTALNLAVSETIKRSKISLDFDFSLPQWTLCAASLQSVLDNKYFFKSGKSQISIVEYEQESLVLNS